MITVVHISTLYNNPNEIVALSSVEGILASVQSPSLSLHVGKRFVSVFRVLLQCRQIPVAR